VTASRSSLPAPHESVDGTQSRSAERALRVSTTQQLFARIAGAGSPDEVIRLRQQVVVANMGVARGLAARYRNRGIPLADLEQVACEGLVKAVARFDPDRDKDFLSFAVPTIRGELKRHFRDYGWAVRPPRRIQELQGKIATATQDLSQRLGRSPKPREVATALHCPEEEVIEALACDGAFIPASLDMPAGDGATTTLGDYLADDNAEAGRAEARIVLGPAVRALGERDRLIVELRFFHGWTQQQIAEKIGVTQMQVSRLLNRIIADLRTAIGVDQVA
jgi:RNA polymerase sigma-B factor